jgi:hypothetical protein
MMANWTFLTSHAWALLCIAHDPEAGLRDIAASQDRTAGDVLALLAGTTRGHNGGLPDPTDDLGRFQQPRGRWP